MHKTIGNQQERLVCNKLLKLYMKTLGQLHVFWTPVLDPGGPRCQTLSYHQTLSYQTLSYETLSYLIL